MKKNIKRLSIIIIFSLILNLGLILCNNSNVYATSAGFSVKSSSISIKKRKYCNTYNNSY